MSMATSYRYEAMTDNKSLQSALQRQQDRIKRDEMMAAREQKARVEEKMRLKSDWNESLQDVAGIQKLKNDISQSRSEVKLAQKACMMVRRAALKKLLEEDYRLFEKELQQLGKAFYIKRT